MEPSELKSRLDSLPNHAGVYLMKDREGVVIYVGKANRLKQRVRQYFQSSGDTRYFITLLPKLIGDIETITTHNPKEALILENELIKKYQPRFNVLLRDDKSFLHIRIDVKSDWPRLTVVRRPKSDGARYFGPYHSASKLRATLKLAEKYFQLRTCDDTNFRNRSRPCLAYQIKRCSAPCVYDVSRSAYAQRVEDVLLFLSGRLNSLVSRLELQMQTAAAELAFEDAARYRDQIIAVKDSLQKQSIVRHVQRNQDVWGLYREGSQISITLLTVRSGRVATTKNFSFDKQGQETDTLLSTACNLYYHDQAEVPDEVILPVPIEDMAVLSEVLSESHSRSVKFLAPQRGAKKKLSDLAMLNAEHAFFQDQQGQERKQRMLLRIQDLYRLNNLPEWIICVDISLFQGGEAVGSSVCFCNGEPYRKRYRRYKIRDVDGTDDFAMMREVLSRLLTRSQKEDQLPNLLVVDGGRGQLNVALSVVADLGLDTIDVVSLAKSRVVEENQRSAERVFIKSSKSPFPLSPHTDEYRLLTHLRDEAHRFAIEYHRKLRTKRNFRGALAQIPGIGTTKEKRLLRHFGSARAVEKADYDELCAAPGIGPSLAKVIWAHFHSAH